MMPKISRKLDATEILRDYVVRVSTVYTAARLANELLSANLINDAEQRLRDPSVCSRRNGIDIIGR